MARSVPCEGAELKGVAVYVTSKECPTSAESRQVLKQRELQDHFL